MNKKIIYIEIFVCILTIFVMSASSYEYGGSGSSSDSEMTGGGGVITCEAANNVIKVEKHDFSIRKGVKSMHAFSEDGMKMYQMYAFGKDDDNSVSLRVEFLKGIPVCTNKPAPGKIYEYINVWTSSQNIKNATLKFKFENSSIESSRILDVFEWNKKNKEWTKLGITNVTKFDKYAYFDFNIENFGPFAIGLSEQDTGGEIPTVTVMETVEATPVYTIEKIVIENDKEITNQKKKSSGFGSIIMIMILLFTTYLSKRR